MSATCSREALEARIAHEREALAIALADLHEQLRAEFDLRRRVRERPAAWLSGALVIGVFLGARR